MNVIFLDYDGVVNIPMWDSDGKNCRYNYPKDGKVNNFQAVQWVSEFCTKYKFDIVVTSSWSLSSNYESCLINGGLREGIKILGKIGSDHTKSRGMLIREYLAEHPEIEGYLIFDDEFDTDMPIDHLILCDSNVGFGMNEFNNAKQMIDDELYKNRYQLVKDASNSDEPIVVSGTVDEAGVKINLRNGETLTISSDELFEAYSKKDENKSE